MTKRGIATGRINHVTEVTQGVRAMPGTPKERTVPDDDARADLGLSTAHHTVPRLRLLACAEPGPCVSLPLELSQSALQRRGNIG